MSSNRRTLPHRGGRWAVAIVLGGVLALLGVACGGGSSSSSSSASADDGSPIRIAAPYGEVFEPMLAAGMKRCEKEGVKATIQASPASYDELGTKLLVQAASGDAPDLAVQGLNQVVPMGDSEYVVDLSPYLDDSKTLKRETMPALAAGEYNGRLVALPWGISTPVLWFNDRLLEEKGLDPDQPVESWDQLQEMAEKLASDGDGGIAIAQQEGYIPLAFLLNSESNVINEAGEPDFNNEGGIEAAEYLHDLYASGTALKGDEEQITAQFTGGKVGILIGSSSFLEAVEAGGFPFTVQEFPPKEAGGELQVPAGGAGIAMYASEDRRDRAWQAVECLFSPTSLKEVVEAVGYMPVRNDISGEFPPKTFSSQPLGPSYAELEDVAPWFNFPGQNFLQATSEFQDAWERATQTDVGVESELDSAAETISHLLPGS